MQELVALITQEQKLFSLLCQRSFVEEAHVRQRMLLNSRFFVESIEIAGEPDAEMRKGRLRLEHA